jgi:hypothetical protein
VGVGRMPSNGALTVLSYNKSFFFQGNDDEWILIPENKSSTIRKLKKNHKRKRSTEEERS